MTDLVRVQLEDQHCVRGDPHTYRVTVLQAVAGGPSVPKDLTA